MSNRNHHPKIRRKRNFSGMWTFLSGYAPRHVSRSKGARTPSKKRGMRRLT